MVEEFETQKKRKLIETIYSISREMKFVKRAKKRPQMQFQFVLKQIGRW